MSKDVTVRQESVDEASNTLRDAAELINMGELAEAAELMQEAADKIDNMETDDA